MDLVALAARRPGLVWAGGVDGQDLMERGPAEAVADEVARQIRDTDALAAGGLFVGTSSELNPAIPAEHFEAMRQATASLRNPAFR
jgi:hypothetical protein